MICIDAEVIGALNPGILEVCKSSVTQKPTDDFGVKLPNQLTVSLSNTAVELLQPTVAWQLLDR